MSLIVKFISATLLTCSMSAQALVTITIQEVGNDVIVSGSGTLVAGDQIFDDLPYSSLDILDPSNFTIQAGTNTIGMAHGGWYTQNVPGNPSIPPTPSYGTGPQVQQPTNNSGDPFSIMFLSGTGFLIFGTPIDYTSGSNLSFRSTYANATLESLGITLGTTHWRGPEDGVILNVIPRASAPTSVPSLGVFSVIGLAGAIGAAGVAMSRRRKQ